MRLSTFGLVGFVALATACGGGGNADDTGDDDTTDPDAPPGAIDADPDGWQSLLEGAWELAPNEEGYYCVYATVPRDMYIKAFRPLIPNGTHHTVLTRYTGSHADGISPCNAGTNGQSMIYGSGVGSPDFEFPTGVGLHLAAGTRLLANLHLYNATDATLTGTSGTLFLEATAAEIEHEAEVVLAGPTITLSVPPGLSVQSGNCTVSQITSVPIQVFSLSQHMHKLGYHMRSTIVRDDTEIELQDIDYDFEQQTFQRVDPFIEVLPTDTIRTECFFDNTTGTTVPFGDSSDDEMCFTDLFYYPAQDAEFICTF